ncbi:MAG: Rrf2 family transcriptional regulator [Rhodospirillales bacterium]|nr:Rrf2 family transcriptional regulator [Rhodospirillales bacterium]
MAAELCRLGYLETVRGPNGGFRLARDSREFRIGDVIRQTEAEPVLVECFDPATNTCPLLPACQLRVALQEARRLLRSSRSVHLGQPCRRPRAAQPAA